MHQSMHNWISCDQCPHWFLNVCMHVENVSDRYICVNYE